jgi:hypothetical protein
MTESCGNSFTVWTDDPRPPQEPWWFEPAIKP